MNNRLLHIATLAPTLLLFASSAWAAECADSADCEAGYECQKAQWVDGCAPDTMECDTTVHEAETGVCVKVPTACETDADCGEYLACVESGGTCAASSDGTTTCDDAEVPKYCGVTPQSCEADEDCPREFECASFTVPCVAAPDCTDQCNCEASAVKQCRPKKVECEDDSVCPTDWRCINTTVTMCSGGGGTSMGGATAVDPGEAVDPVPPTEPMGKPTPTDAPQDVPAGGASSDLPSSDGTCTTVPAVGYCVPKAWGEGTISYDGPALPGGETVGSGEPEPNDPKDGPVDGSGTTDDGTEPPSSSGGPGPVAGDADEPASRGGCVAAPSAPTRAAWSLVGLLLLAPLMRRKSSPRVAS